MRTIYSVTILLILLLSCNRDNEIQKNSDEKFNRLIDSLLLGESRPVKIDYDSLLTGNKRKAIASLI